MASHWQGLWGKWRVTLAQCQSSLHPAALDWSPHPFLPILSSSHLIILPSLLLPVLHHSAPPVKSENGAATKNKASLWCLYGVSPLTGESNQNRVKSKLPVNHQPSRALFDVFFNSLPIWYLIKVGQSKRKWESEFDRQGRKEDFSRLGSLRHAVQKYQWKHVLFPSERSSCLGKKCMAQENC